MYCNVHPDNNTVITVCNIKISSHYQTHLKLLGYCMSIILFLKKKKEMDKIRGSDSTTKR